MVKCPRCGYDNLPSTTYCEKCSYIIKNPPVRQKKSGWNMGTAKKVALIIGIIAIALVLFSVIYNYSRPSNEESLNVIEADNNVQPSSSQPYQLKIIYGGDWYSNSGNANYLQNNTGHGTQLIKLDCASWDTVSVFVEKSDGSSEKMTVQLLRNGEVVAENSTTNSQLTFSYSS
ncbi:zinc ribbon domain-containing protein [uncultured Methanobrevibacter sp.]|uniref:zinc ribbon domain-containing protein n=1 Tax=uncultured Methanobrevibacter sp. TaxID=253161 RepID=UPI0025E94035|nr:zinc ribbon domain-containing protein [uncultured Methanobrevibacter sp.]